MRPAVVSPNHPLPELDELNRLIELGGAHVQARTLCRVEVGGRVFEVPAISLGNPSRDAPAIGYFGGVHGLERIGAEVVIAYLTSLIQRLRWDEVLHHQLSQMRMVFMPLVNPGGLWLGTRANPRGVDLMRNAPVEAAQPVPWLLGGHRLSAALPWYRGPQGAPMEPESDALCWLVTDELFGRPFSLAIDCHSGFGLQDRIWFPPAHTSQPLPHLAELHALHRVFQQTHAHHNYVFEPQNLQYLTHGDLWDHLYLCHGRDHPTGVFLPLTLEMGSWMWVKKNPRQLFSRHGIFNPLIAHRQQRVLRRHVALMDFLGRAAASHLRWLPAPEERDLHERQARARWYQDRPRRTQVPAPAPATVDSMQALPERALPQGTWLLLRGLTREAGHWGDFAENWARELSPGSQVLTPDLAGNGSRCHDRSPASVPGLLESLREDLQARGIAPPYRVIAMSLGAMVTVEWAHRHPHELTNVVLINTSLKPHSPMWHRLRPRWWPRILGLLLRRASAERWERSILSMTTRHPHDTDATLAHWLHLRTTHPPQAMNGLRQLWAAARYRAPHGHPQVPTLLLTGQGDRLVHPSCSSVLAERWGAPIVRHPTAGHDLPLDAGPWVRQQILRWLAQRATQPPA